jgi:hypothetical protein
MINANVFSGLLIGTNTREVAGFLIVKLGTSKWKGGGKVGQIRMRISYQEPVTCRAVSDKHACYFEQVKLFKMASN